MKATGHVAAHSSGQIFIREKMSIQQDKYNMMTEPDLKIRDSFHKVVVMTHGNNN